MEDITINIFWNHQSKPPRKLCDRWSFIGHTQNRTYSDRQKNRYRQIQ